MPQSKVGLESPDIESSQLMCMLDKSLDWTIGMKCLVMVSLRGIVINKKNFNVYKGNGLKARFVMLFFLEVSTF